MKRSRPAVSTGRPSPRPPPPRRPKPMVEEIIILSSDDDETNPIQTQIKGESIRANSTLENRLLADDEDEIIITNTERSEGLRKPNRSNHKKSPSLLDNADDDLFLFESDTAGLEAKKPSHSKPEADIETQNGEQNKDNEGSPLVALEHQEEEMELEPSPSVDSEEIGKEYRESCDPLAGIGETDVGLLTTSNKVNQETVEAMTVNILDPINQASVKTDQSNINGIRIPITSVVDDGRQPSTSSAAASISSCLPQKRDYSQIANTEMESLLLVVEKSPKLKLSLEELARLKTKFWNFFDKLNLSSSSKDFQKKISESIKSARMKIGLGEDKIWTYLQKLMKFLKDSKGGESSLETNLKKKEKKIELIEAKLKELETLIEHWDSRDDEFDDDEINSPYLTKDRLVKKFMRYYEMLCKITDCNTYTGRPTQKSIKLDRVINDPEVTAAVQSFLNKQNFLFTPDFSEILKIAQDVNNARAIHRSEEVILENAKLLFTRIVKIVKKRRAQEFLEVLPFDQTSEDPADNDPELMEKLKQNDSQKKTEAQVLKEFTELQSQSKTNENAMEAPDEEEDLGKTTDEEEDEEEDASTNDDSDFINDTVIPVVEELSDVEADNSRMDTSGISSSIETRPGYLKNRILNSEPESCDSSDEQDYH